MPNEDEWRGQIITAMTSSPVAVLAHTYLNMKFSSLTAPFLFGCNDGKSYVVKCLPNSLPDAPRIARSMCNDQIVGHLAAAIGAPVPATSLVDIPAEIRNNHPDLARISAGIGHGSEYNSKASKIKQGFANQNVPANRTRFALLAILYGWIGLSDHQFFYQDVTNVIWSFDHGHSFCGNPEWTVAALQSQRPPAVPDQIVVNNCQLTSNELNIAKLSLQAIDDQTIAAAISTPPENWNVTLAERVALAVYLDNRRSQIVNGSN